MTLTASSTSHHLYVPLPYMDERQLTITVAVRLWIPFHGCHRGADAASQRCRYHTRFIRADPLQRCLHPLPLYVVYSNSTTYHLSTSTTNIVAVVNVLLHIYAVHAWPEGEPTDAEEGAKYTHANGRTMNGRARTTSEATRIQDAEAFELQGLISDEEEGAGSSMGPKKAEDEEMAKESAHH